MNKATSMSDSMDDLWGSTMLSINVDLQRSRIVLKGEILDSGLRRNYSMKLIGVSKCGYDNRLLDEWSYIELTSIEAAQRGICWAVKMDFWGIAVLEVECLEIDLEILP